VLFASDYPHWDELSGSPQMIIERNDLTTMPNENHGRKTCPLVSVGSPF
jgi:hypothetical protein